MPPSNFVPNIVERPLPLSGHNAHLSKYFNYHLTTIENFNSESNGSRNKISKSPSKQNIKYTSQLQSLSTKSNSIPQKVELSRPSSSVPSTRGNGSNASTSSSNHTQPLFNEFSKNQNLNIKSIPQPNTVSLHESAPEICVEENIKWLYDIIIPYLQFDNIISCTKIDNKGIDIKYNVSNHDIVYKKYNLNKPYYIFSAFVNGNLKIRYVTITDENNNLLRSTKNLFDKLSQLLIRNIEIKSIKNLDDDKIRLITCDDKSVETTLEYNI